jgi:uroporphyrinogen III methyltransferase/synthase
MGIKNIDNISRNLMIHGMEPSTPAALVRWGTTPRQVSLASDLEHIASECQEKGLKAPAVLIVGSVVTLRKSLSWYESKPLFGKKIVVTRSKDQSRKMADKILKYGGEPILFPTIEIVDPIDFGPLENALQTISDYDWLLFTSENGVERFFKHFFDLGKDIRELAGPRFGAIGPITAKAIRSKGIKVDMLAKEFVAEGMLEFFENQSLEGKRFLIPRAEKARDVLPDGLKRRGAKVDVVNVYRTVRPSGDDVKTIKNLFVNRSVDAVTFTSSSTVDHFVDMMNVSELSNLLNDAVVASIGPITSDTLVKYGVDPSVQAEEFTVDGLIEALVNYYDSANSTVPIL